MSNIAVFGTVFFFFEAVGLGKDDGVSFSESCCFDRAYDWRWHWRVKRWNVCIVDEGESLGFIADYWTQALVLLVVSLVDVLTTKVKVGSVSLVIFQLICLR